MLWEVKRKSASCFVLWTCLIMAGIGGAEAAPDPSTRGAYSLTHREHSVLGTDPERGGALLEIASPDLPSVHFRLSRTSALEYLDWISGAKIAVAEQASNFSAASEGVANLYKFGLDWGVDEEPLPVESVMPRQIQVMDNGRLFEAIEFVAIKRPQRNRILYSLQGDKGNGRWTSVESSEISARVELGDGLERRTLRETLPSFRSEFRRLRVTIRYEPVPTIFAHYVSDLNPGWSAMAHLTRPIPAHLRLFHDESERMQPVPQGPSDRFQSTGGVHRDLPLLYPGHAFSSARESAELEIRRARRGGIDGFAVNCLGGRTDFLEALFDAAAGLEKEGDNHPPFLITLSVDINVIPFEDREMLAAVADLVGAWLAAGQTPERREHLARRGGKPLVMGYQSHWIWIDYLERLFELWEREEILGLGWDDERLRWPSSLGPAPRVPALPSAIVAQYRLTIAGRIAQLKALNDPLEEEVREDFMFFQAQGLPADQALARACETVARRGGRAEAVRSWARHPDGWTRIRKAYQLLERLVGREIFWQFDAVDMDAIAGDPERALQVVGRDFPAVNLFLPKGDYTALARRVIRDSGAEWGEPIGAQYVAYGQNEQKGLYWGNVRSGEGTGTLRRSWYQAMGTNLETGEAVVPSGLSSAPDGRSSLIQYTTWNDYGEHSHLAPSLQMRYALLELNRVFIRSWKTGEQPTEQGEQLFLFYRKYPEIGRAKTFPFQHGPNLNPPVLEVVTILREEEGRLDLLREDPSSPGRFAARSDARRLRSGFQVETYTGDGIDRLWAEGAVTARIVKGSGEILSATGWEEVTHRPFRQDETLVAASSKCEELWKMDMEETQMEQFTHSEYGDVDGDGLPNWFEMFYFGQGWLNLTDRAGAMANGDENRDGKTNLTHYLDGTNPIFFSEPIPYNEDRSGSAEPFRIDSRRKTRLPAEEFDRGGLGVAYGRGDYETMQAGTYRKTHYDLASHRQVDAHEEDGGEWVVAPLADGEWQTYTLEIPAGCYRISARVRGGGGELLVELDGVKVLQAAIADRGLWSTQAVGTIDVTPLQAGERVLRLRFLAPGYGLNWIEFERCPTRWWQ